VTDLFESGFALPAEAWIVCPGERGRAYHGHVPRSAATIAVNYAISANVEPKVHFVADSDAPWAWWWSDPPAGVTRVYSRQLIERGQRADYSFAQDPGLTCEDYQPRPGVLRCNGSGLGGALQLCWHRGPANMTVYVVGADLDGTGYFDGSHVREYRSDHFHVFHRRLELLVSWLRGHGMTIVFVSSTALAVERS